MNTYPSQFLSSGIAVIPIQHRDKRPEFSLLPTDNKGHRVWEPYKSMLPSHTELKTWLRFDVNYGVVMGWNNLVVIDFDNRDVYTKWLLWATRQNGIANLVARTAFQVTSARGVHVYCRLVAACNNMKLSGIDIKIDGYVLGPGSIHPSGIEYQVLRSGFNFPLVTVLSDILPASLLTERPVSGKPNPQFTINIPYDPWAVVNSGKAVTKDAVVQIKKHVRIEQLLGDLIPTGDSWYLTRCPLHDDHNPSMWVDLDRQICGCYSGCTTKPLDVINLYARMYGLSNEQAIRMLVERI